MVHAVNLYEGERACERVVDVLEGKDYSEWMRIKG